jgi:hypothetical protein
MGWFVGCFTYTQLSPTHSPTQSPTHSHAHSQTHLLHVLCHFDFCSTT